MDLLSCIIVIIIVIIVTVLYIKFNRKTRMLKDFPSPPKNFILGNILDLPSTKVMHLKFAEYIQKYGENVKVFLGPIPNLLLVSEPDLAEYLITSPHAGSIKSKQIEYLKNWLGNGLLTSPTDSRWKRQRKIIGTAFHNKILHQFIPIMNHQCDILVEKLKTEVTKSSFDICPFITMCSLDIICETAMGTSVNAQQDHSSEYIKNLATMLQIVIDRTIQPLFKYDFLYKLSSTYKKEEKIVQVLHDYTNSVIAKKKLQINSIKENGDSELELKKIKSSLLDLLLRTDDHPDYLNDEDIRSEVDTFMSAGHDTTASAVSFALYLLSEHLDVQEKAAEEINSILSDSNCEFTFENLNNLKYLEAVIKETLRLYPTVSVIARDLHEDCKFRDMVLPKGITVFVNLYALHRNSKYHEHPDDFIPERYLSENKSNNSSYTYIPFGGGLRNCIGQKFAMLEVKCMLASILFNYKILPTIPKHKLDVVNEVVLKSDNGVWVRLEERR